MKLNPEFIERMKLLLGEDYENYEIPDTLTYKRWDMRFQGYPMYWQCK